MAVTALLLALAAAVVHAIWNLLIADAEDPQSAAAVAVAVGVVVFAPVAAWSWRLESSALAYAAGSSALELLYLALLTTGYTVAAMSFVYPIARGSAPVLVLAVSALALGRRLSVVAAVGVLLVAGGIVLVRGLRGGTTRVRHLGLALSVGACIAGYTLLDQRGIRHASPIAYLELVLAVTAAAYVAGVWRARGAGALHRAVTWRTVLAGVGVFGSYVLVLAALRLAPAASVAAVRESSVVIAAVWLALSGRERVGAERLAGAVAVVAGIALISLG
jgi:drug/metabolite transporter (DMT)-like permease